MQLVTTASRDQQLVPTTRTKTFHKNKHYFCLNINIRVALIWDGHQFGTLFTFTDNKLFVWLDSTNNEF